MARAFLQAEGPVVARQALRLKDHGGGLAYSLKNVGTPYLPVWCLNAEHFRCRRAVVCVCTRVRVTSTFFPPALTRLHRTPQQQSRAKVVDSSPMPSQAHT